MHICGKIGCWGMSSFSCIPGPVKPYHKFGIFLLCALLLLHAYDPVVSNCLFSVQRDIGSLRLGIAADILACSLD